MQLVDSHCHLQFKKLSADVEGVIERAKSADVGKMICVGTSLEDSSQAIALAEQFDNVWATAGAHPHDGKDFPTNGADVLTELLKKPKIVAVGEIGLDYYKDYSPRADQRAILKTQIEAGLQSGLPFVFHVRDAWDDFWPIYDSYRGLTGVVHSFSATIQELDQVMKRDLYVGLNGIMTFTSDEAQLAAAKTVPLDKLLLETDAPFLTPKAFRGQTCEPKYIREIAEFLAELRGETLEQLAEATTNNSEKLFGL